MQNNNVNILIHGDSIEEMKKLHSNSIDYINTDSPYFLVNNSGSGFMNCSWDSVNKNELNIKDMLKESEDLKEAISIIFENNHFPNLNEIKEQILKSIPNDSNELTHKLVQKFHSNWLNECYRILKYGHFITITYTCRLDSLRDILNSLYESKFKFNFSPLFWSYHNGFMKGSNQVTSWDKKLFLEWLNKDENKEDLTKLENLKKKVKEESKKLMELIKSNPNEKNPIQKQQNKRDQLVLKKELFKLNLKRKWAKNEYNLDLIFTFEEHWARKNRSYISEADIFSSKKENKVRQKKNNKLNPKSNPDFSSSQYDEYGKMMYGYKGERIPNFNNYIVIDYSKHHSKGRKNLSHKFMERISESEFNSPLGDNKIQQKAISPQANKMQDYYSGFQPSPSVELIIVAMKELGFKCKECNEIENIKYLENNEIECLKCGFKGKGIRMNYMENGIQNFGGVSKLNRIPLTENEKNSEYTTDRKLDQGSSGFPSDYNESKSWNKDVKKDCIGISNNSEEGRFMSNLIIFDDVLNNKKDHKSNKNNPFVLKHNLFNEQIKNEESNSRFYDIDLWFKEYISKINIQNIKGLETIPFIQIPKPSELEKDLGLNNELSKLTRDNRQTRVDYPSQRGETIRNNFHPTIKPIKLASYLLEIFSKPKDLVLDCFCGSGSYLIACLLANRIFIGIDNNLDYINLSSNRIKAFIELIKIKISQKKIDGNEYIFELEDILSIKKKDKKKLKNKTNQKMKEIQKNNEYISKWF